MIPIKDDNPTYTTPYVVYILIAINVLVFIYDRIYAHGPVGALWNYSMIPAEIVYGNGSPTPVQLAQNVVQFHNHPNPAWITIFTSMFLHGGIIHLGGNMLYLWIFGHRVEDVLGHIKFLSFYLIGGVIAAATHIASDPTSIIPTVGASGAIAAILGAYIVLYPGSRIWCLVWFFYYATTVAVPAVFVLGFWLLLQIINVHGGMTPTGGVAYWAHIGGFAAGFLAILLMGRQRLLRNRPIPKQINERYWYED